MSIIINTSLEESKRKFKQYQEKDPFPDIAPALLNSSDIIDYAREACVLSPFIIDNDFLKPASYSIEFDGYYIYWDWIRGKSKKVEGQLKEGEYLTLKSNSITFIRLKPYIQLPIYLAARFNLQIKHVYRGLLLGTGPLVDPGWYGYLNIPIHNLTGEDYKIKMSEPMIWMEFTKVSPNYLWLKDADQKIKSGKIIRFKETSQNIKLVDYLYKAEPNTPIQSSLPQALNEYEKTLEDSKNINKRTDRLLGWFSLSVFLGMAGIISSVAGFGWYVYNIHRNSQEYLINSKGGSTKNSEDSKEIKQTIIHFYQIVDSLGAIQKNQQKEIEILRKQIKNQ